MLNYHNKIFRAIHNTANGEIGEENRFHYFQHGNVVTCTYSGGKVVEGHLIGIVDKDGTIDMRYHQVNKAGEILTGKCISTPELMPDGKIKLHEKWEWTSGDFSQGTSTLIEL